MMKRCVTIVDYGMGNLFSVVRAFEHCGAKTILADTPDAVSQAQILVLPGVGAFPQGMAGLEQRKLTGPIKTFASSGLPFLGICLGMQMMMDYSEEFGVTRGLGLIPGKVTQIPRRAVDGLDHKIPHIGWSPLVKPAGADWSHSLLSTTAESATAYFVHSFGVVPEKEGSRLADCYYGGHRIAAAIRSGSLYGCQFHPEKSGTTGLSILKRFLQGDGQ
jgi:glutamine amidotransferase